MSNPSESLLQGFRDVDSAAKAKILRCLATLAKLDDVARYKAFALDCLGLSDSSSALDVACGLGDDVARLGERCGRAVGVDGSAALLEQARRNHPASNLEFLHADAASLPLADSSFDAVRIDRSLQHIAEPSRVVAEMARVARPGGVVLCAEPDWGTFLIGGPHNDITETIEHDWIRGFRNPWIGRELPGLLKAAGVAEVRCEGFWLATRGFEPSDVLFEIEDSAKKLAANGRPEALSWLETYRQGEAYAGVLVMVCWGRKT